MNQAKENSKRRPPTKGRKKILRWVLASCAAVIVLAVLLVPVFVSSEAGNKFILAKINAYLPGETDFGNLSMGWLKGIRVTDVSFEESGGQASVRIKRIATRPHYGPILMGSLSFGETEIFEPKVEINLTRPEARAPQGPQRERTAAEKSQPIALPIKKIEMIVRGGNLKVTDTQSETVELSQINSKVDLRPPGQQTNFDIDFAVVDKGKQSQVHTTGKINPKRVKTGWSLKGTSGDLTVEVNDLEIGSLGPIFALGGIEVQANGRISGNVKGEIKDGRLEKLSAEVKGRDLDVNAVELTGGRFKTSHLGINVKLARAKQMINIESFDIEADWLKAEGRGTIPTTFGSLAEFLRTDSSLSGRFELDAAQIFTQMPGIFGLKEGIKVTSGILRGEVETLTEDGKRKIAGQANLERLEGMVAGKMIALSEPVRAEVEITSDKGGVRFDKLDLSSAFATINCSGTSELFGYRGNINLAKLQSELGQFVDIKRYEMAGELSGEGEVSIKKDKVTVSGSSAVKNLRLSSTEGVSAFEPMADITFLVAVEKDKKILGVDFIKANASLGQISIKDAVLPLGKDAEKEMSLDVSAKSVDLQKLQPFAVLLASFPAEMQLSGTVESQISVRSKKDIYYIATDATQIKNLKVSYPGKEPFEQNEVSVTFDAEVNPVEKAVTVRKFQLESPQIKIRKGEFSRADKGDKTKLQGQAECEYDWAAVSTIAGAILPTGLVLEGQRKDTVRFSSEYPRGQADKLLGNLTAYVKLGFSKAGYYGLNFGPTEVDVQIENGLLKIAPFSSTVNNGRLNFAGRADFKDKPALLKTPGPMQIAEDIQITNEMTSRLLMYLNPIFARAVNVSGAVDLSSERFAVPLAGGNKNDIELAGTISVKQLRLETSELLGQILAAANIARAQDITISPTRFVLQNGLLRYDDMQMYVGKNPVNFKGVIGLDKSLNMTVTLPYTTGGETARAGKETSGRRITLALKGTLDRPEIDLGKVLEEQLKQELEEQLQEKLLEGLDKLLK